MKYLFIGVAIWAGLMILDFIFSRNK